MPAERQSDRHSTLILTYDNAIYFPRLFNQDFNFESFSHSGVDLSTTGMASLSLYAFSKTILFFLESALA